MTTPPNTSFTTRLNPSLSQSSIPESSSSSAYPHQYLPRRSHSERSQQRSSHHHARDNDLPPLPIPDMSAEARRQSLMAMDRKRRLTASSQETGRRRTTTGGFTNRDNQFYHTRPSGQISQPSASPTPASALTQVIDLTASSPPAPVRPNVPSRSHRTSSTGSRGYVVPSWQPDTDVSECPICKRPFTFLFRRHHCRKCGRVVCNECSPHRITIPRQYIVHPPGEEEQSLFSNPNIVDLTRDEDDNTGHPASPLRINPALGGGEKVRLCNPCVPDPQPELQSIFNEPASRPLPLPPAPPANSSLFPSQSSVPGFSRYSPQVLPPPRFSNPRDQPLPQLPHPGTRVHVESDEEDDEIGSSFERYHNSTSRRLIPPQSHARYHPNSHSHSRYHSLDATRPPPIPPFPFNNHTRMLSMLESSRRQQNAYGQPPNFQALPSLPPTQPSASSSASANPRPPRPRVREEDICPICRGMLPPKGPNGNETERETHIMECISQYDTSATATPPSQLVQQRTRSSTQTTTFSGSTPLPGLQPPISASLPTSPPPPRAMPMQMLRFIATEKDCGIKTEGDGGVPTGDETGGEDVQPQECSICMVEYEVGERLARLECWCKFHEECIVEWFGRKRECPVHKLS